MYAMKIGRQDKTVYAMKMYQRFLSHVPACDQKHIVFDSQPNVLTVVCASDRSILKYDQFEAKL